MARPIPPHFGVPLQFFKNGRPSISPGRLKLKQDRQKIRARFAKVNCIGPSVDIGGVTIAHLVASLVALGDTWEDTQLVTDGNRGSDNCSLAIKAETWRALAGRSGSPGFCLALARYLEALGERDYCLTVGSLCV